MLNTNLNYENANFAICTDIMANESYQINIDSEVKNLLFEILNDTIIKYNNQFHTLTDNERNYELSQDYGPKDSCLVRRNEDYLQYINETFNSFNNLPNRSGTLNNLATNIDFYFVQFKRGNGGPIIGFKRSVNFKKLFKKRNKLVGFTNNTLTIVNETMFILDETFDFLMDSQYVYILNPLAFPHIASLKRSIMKNAAELCKSMHEKVDFINFSVMENYVKDHIRAANYLTAINTRNDLSRITKGNLIETLDKLEINYSIPNGRVEVNDNQYLEFLSVLDRRRYGYDLIPGEREYYLAVKRYRR